MQVRGCCAKRLQHVKRLLATAIALSTLGVLPVRAGSVWLIIKEADYRGTFALDVDKIEMENMEQCEEQGALYVSSKRMGRYKLEFSGFECLEGK